MRHFAIVAAGALLLSGCASIISGSHDDILVRTEPQGADCTVYRGADVLGHVNPTPGGIVVSRSYDDIFVKCSKEGYGDGEKENTSGLNGWVFGNIIFGLIGGPIGAIVDTSTANATSYDSTTYVTLPPKPAQPPVATTPQRPTAEATPNASSSAPTS